MSEGRDVDRVLREYLSDMDQATSRQSGVRPRFASEPPTRRVRAVTDRDRPRAVRRVIVVDSEGVMYVAGVLELFDACVRATWYQDGWAVRIHLERGIEDGAGPGKAEPSDPERWFAAIRYAFAGTHDVFVADGTRTRRETVSRIAARVVYRQPAALRAEGRRAGTSQ